MFITSSNALANDRVSIIGEFVRLDGNYVVLKLSNGYINVVPKGFDKYKSKYVLVTGTLEDSVLTEEVMQPIEDDFDMNLFHRFTKQMAKYPEIF